MYIRCAAYRNGQRIGDVSVENISELLAEPDTFLWVGLTEPDPNELLQLQEEFGLHELAVEDARSAHQRPKLEEYKGSLFVVLHTVELQDGKVHFGETHLFVGKQFLISIRHQSSLGYGRARVRCESMPQLLAKGSGFALYAVLDLIVDNFMPVVEHYQSLLEKLEEDIFENRLHRDAMERLYDLKRCLLRLRNAAMPLLDVCNALMRLHPDVVSKELRVYFRDVHDHVHRIIRATDTMRETLSDAMQANLALITVRQNEVVKRLAGWGAILALPTMVFSMYGMNFKFMPELDFRFGYPAALAGTLIGCVWLYRRLKRAEWL
ncbi:magnesium/cobalt transporter CorA [Methylocaldum sp. BRCS4]|uniref:magnesium/cobalt transporter CorA n=1 Tax=Methylocaldum sp. 14B TaxID=1912213 RepID=UPI00098A02EA|nr:magnesium/cobalt transporter CorA [Methylocaldum sp. 14B]MVF24099.1 magnesium/cobalt transporter CorA [Methylocaldum sp. BRCS4]